MFCKKERLVKKNYTYFSRSNMLPCFKAIDMFMHELVQNAPMHFLHMTLMLHMPEGQTLATSTRPRVLV